MKKNLYIIEENRTFSDIKNNNFRNELKNKINEQETNFIRKNNIETFILDIKRNPTLLKKLSNNRLKKLMELYVRLC